MANNTTFETINIDDFIHEPINQEKVQSYPPELVGRFNSFIVTSFDDSMTVEMQLRTLIKWIKENIDVTMSALDNMEAFKQDSMAFQNHVKDTLVNLINQFTDQFDDNLQFEMQEILKQWDEDGYLQNLINEYTHERIDDVMNQKISKGNVLVSDLSAEVIEYFANAKEVGFPVVGDGAVNSPDKLKDNVVTPSKTTFLVPTSNIFDKTKRIKGKYVNNVTGALLDHENHWASVFTPVRTGDIITTKDVTNLRIAEYSTAEEKGFNRGSYPMTTPYVIGENTNYIRFSTTQDPESFMMEKKSIPSADYVPYGYYMPLLVQNKTTDTTSVIKTIINLPTKIYATIGKQLNLINNSITETNYQLDYSCTIGKQVDTGFETIPSTVITTPLNVELYDKYFKINGKQISLIVNNQRTTPIKMMLIGDSTVRTNGSGDVTARIKENLGTNVELIGTMGSGENKWEGRGGWTAKQYRTGDSYEDIVNPFFNPATDDFDFGYYMAQNSFTSVDVVVINLGINDMFNHTTKDSLDLAIVNTLIDLDFIINNIKTYNSSIKVAVNITIPPNAHQSAFGNAYGNGQTQWRYNLNNLLWVDALIKKYDGKVDLIPINSVINTETDIADGVHPTLNGYQKIGDMITNYLNSI